MKFQPIFDRFIQNFELKYEDLENIKTNRVDTVVFNLHQIKQRTFFGGTRHFSQISVPGSVLSTSD